MAGTPTLGRPGYACRCHQCEAERRGEPELFQPGIFCAGCGHGYLDTRQPDRVDVSGCSKCGTRQQWLEAKPVLAFAPDPSAVDRALEDAAVLVARISEMYRPEYIEKASAFDAFGLFSTAKRLEARLEAVKASESGLDWVSVALPVRAPRC